ncbi:MAG: type II RES/Xre toxin-antitoxin system antitoxin [Bacteroidota bacterium]
MSHPLTNVLRSEGVQYTLDNDMDVITMSRKGVSKQLLLALSDLSGISIHQLAQLLPITQRTIQRYDNEQKFSRDVSEHILIIVRVVDKTYQVLEGQDAVKDWLTTPLVGLGQRTPLSLLDTSFGAQLVMDELGRLEHGVYS